MEEIDRLVNATLVEHAHSSLDKLVHAMVNVMVDAHATDPELHAVMFSEVPHRPEGTRDFAVRLHGAFRLALSSKAQELKRGRDLDKLAFVVSHMVDSLADGAVLRRPPGVSLVAAKEEAVRAIVAYLRA